MTNDYITVMSHTYDANGSPPTGGRITAQKDASTGAITGYTVHHHITDHLGSVRAMGNLPTVFSKTGEYVAYEVHTHEQVTSKATSAIASKDDKEAKNLSGRFPSVVLGYEGRIDHSLPVTSLGKEHL